MQQTIRFITLADGARLAVATSGSGAPLVKSANWLLGGVATRAQMQRLTAALASIVD